MFVSSRKKPFLLPHLLIRHAFSSSSSSDRKSPCHTTAANPLLLDISMGTLDSLSLRLVAHRTQIVVDLRLTCGAEFLRFSPPARRLMSSSKTKRQAAHKALPSPGQSIHVKSSRQSNGNADRENAVIKADMPPQPPPVTCDQEAAACASTEVLKALAELLLSRAAPEVGDQVVELVRELCPVL